MEQHRGFFKVCWYASIVCYLISFIPPVYSTSSSDNEYYQGIWMFFFGWLAPSETLFLVWLANPIFIWLQFSLLARNSNLPNLPASRGMRIGAYLAVVFGALFFIHGNMVENEGGTMHPIVAYHLGYWLWEASMILLAVTMMAKSNQLTLESRLVEWFLRMMKRIH